VLRIVVPYPPGTGPDILARRLAVGLGKDLNTTVVVENKPGANAIIGTTDVVKSPADGRTALLVDRLSLTANPLLYRSLPYDPARDLVAVGTVADVAMYVVVNSRLPVTDFKSLIDHARNSPQALEFGTGGVGSAMHLNMELLEAATGVKFLHVPYKALAEVIPAMLAGQVKVTVGGIEAMLPFVQNGSFRLLAVSGNQRTRLTPDVPTIQEALGAPALLSTSYTLMARTGTPAAALQRLQAALAAEVQRDDFAKWAAARGLAARSSTRREVEAELALDHERLSRLVRERHISVQ
jgi:tripartite-type tricarboxylate transporter receptor subunit TctC